MSSFKINKNFTNNKKQILINKLIQSNKKEEQLINILIRTTYRPQYFNQCIASVLNQRYSNYRVICCYDDERCLEYLKKYDDKIEYFFIEIESNASHKYNLYLNNLIDRVNDGWIMFLDDDDKFYNEYCLLIMNSLLNNYNNILFWQVNLAGNIKIPKNINNIQKGQISGIGFCFHSKFKHLSKWPSIRCGDFYFIDLLLKQHNFNRLKLLLILTEVNHELGGNNGLQTMYSFKDFIKNKDIKQINVSNSLIHLKDKINAIFNLRDYDNINEVCIFFGVYVDEDYNKINNHKGKKFVMFEGSDISNHKMINAQNYLTTSLDIQNKFKDMNMFSRLIYLNLDE
tara:strand:+ start:159 stop:1184 length:1026 start_codon:yes stop_codon:yes gene_type:complete